MCLLMSFIHFDKFPGYSVKCSGIREGNQPALAPGRACENQWCWDKLAINVDICSTSSSSFSYAEHNNKINKIHKQCTLCALVGSKCAVGRFGEGYFKYRRNIGGACWWGCRLRTLTLNYVNFTQILSFRPAAVVRRVWDLICSKSRLQSLWIRMAVVTHTSNSGRYKCTFKTCILVSNTFYLPFSFLFSISLFFVNFVTFFFM